MQPASVGSIAGVVDPHPPSGQVYGIIHAVLGTVSNVAEVLLAHPDSLDFPAFGENINDSLLSGSLRQSANEHSPATCWSLTSGGWGSLGVRWIEHGQTVGDWLLY